MSDDDWIEPLLLKYSPKHARRMWICINSIILTCSVLLILEIFMTLDPADRLEGTRAYLTYNTVVCFAWTVESALHFLQYRHDQEATTTTLQENDNNNNAEWYALMVELLFAIYFLFDSVRTFKVMWYQPSSVGAQLFDVSIDAVAYIYLLTRLVMFTKDEESGNNNERQEEDTPYVGAEMA